MGSKDLHNLDRVLRTLEGRKVMVCSTGNRKNEVNNIKNFHSFKFNMDNRRVIAFGEYNNIDTGGNQVRLYEDYIRCVDVCSCSREYVNVFLDIGQGEIIHIISDGNRKLHKRG